MATEERPIPDKIGRYKILCELGHGAMAVLYLGRVGGIGSFERLFAIKMIHEHLCREQVFVNMFLNEARLCARIHHPNVISVYEVDVENGRYFLAMDYMSGENLALTLKHTWNRSRPFPINIGAHIIAQAAEGLHAAHELKDPAGHRLDVVHRDVAPQNIMIGYDGTIRVMDFGIAKAADTVSLTRPGTMKGTVAYMAPEQVRGEPLDRRVDVFALGVVLWETTVGKRLFKSSNDINTAARVLRMGIPRPSTLRDDYPPRLEQIVQKALSRDLASRYQTARELGDDLQDFLTKDGQRVTPADVETFMKDVYGDMYTQRAEMERKASSPEAPERVASLDARDETGGLAVLNVPGADTLDRLDPSIFTREPSRPPHAAPAAKEPTPKVTVTAVEPPAPKTEPPKIEPAKLEPPKNGSATTLETGLILVSSTPAPAPVEKAPEPAPPPIKKTATPTTAQIEDALLRQFFDGETLAEPEPTDIKTSPVVVPPSITGVTPVPNMQREVGTAIIRDGRRSLGRTPAPVITASIEGRSLGVRSSNVVVTGIDNVVTEPNQLSASELTKQTVVEMKPLSIGVRPAVEKVAVPAITEEPTRIVKNLPRDMTAVVHSKDIIAEDDEPAAKKKSIAPLAIGVAVLILAGLFVFTRLARTPQQEAINIPPVAPSLVKQAEAAPPPAPEPAPEPAKVVEAPPPPPPAPEPQPVPEPERAPEPAPEPAKVVEEEEPEVVEVAPPPPEKKARPRPKPQVKRAPRPKPEVQSAPAQKDPPAKKPKSDLFGGDDL